MSWEPSLSAVGKTLPALIGVSALCHGGLGSTCTWKAWHVLRGGQHHPHCHGGFDLPVHHEPYSRGCCFTEVQMRVVSLVLEPPSKILQSTIGNGPGFLLQLFCRKNCSLTFQRDFPNWTDVQRALSWWCIKQGHEQPPKDPMNFSAFSFPPCLGHFSSRGNVHVYLFLPGSPASSTSAAPSFPYFQLQITRQQFPMLTPPCLGSPRPFAWRPWTSVMCHVAY